MKNNQKGITLVALVITIIVLLILAGVTIASLSGDNGILNRGKESKESNEREQVKELIQMAANEGMEEDYAVNYVEGATSTKFGEAAKTAKTAVIAAIESIRTTDNKIAGVNVTHTDKDDIFELDFSGGKEKATIDINGQISYSNIP